MSSYMLDRELLLTALGSGRPTAATTAATTQLHTTTTTSNWIDANSNAALLGTTLYQRTTDNEVKKQMTDLQDQLKMLRSDLDRKDKLIFELSSYRETEKARACECSKLDAIFHVDKTSVEMMRRELATTQAKLETVGNEMTEYKIKVQAKEEKIAELKLEMESLKSENSTLNGLIVTQRNKIRELENELGSYESVAGKSGLTITNLQHDNKKLQQTVLELESRIKTHMMEREEAERKVEAIVTKMNELAISVTTVTGCEITGNTAGIELLIKKFGEIYTENNTLKGKLMTVTEHLTSVESENKANRETIQRLVGEISKIEKDAGNSKVLSDQLKAERDSALTTKSILEKEIETLKERIGNIQTAWQASKTELETKEVFLTSQSANYKQLEYDALYAKNCLSAFKEQVATLLSDGFVKVEANEDQIKEKVKLLMTSSKDRGLMIASMEGKIQQLANQLNEQINLYKELEAKYHRTEAHSIEVETRFKSLDSEYCANEVMRENLRSDRMKYFSFLERIGSILKINEISADLGLDMNVDLIVARLEQLIKMESESLTDKQTNIYNLQRKCKSLKEQLDNKELHLDLLRKKLASLEEERSAKCALEKEVDDHVAMSKKFKLKVEKLSEQLNALKCENESLKAQIMDINCIKFKSTDQEKEIEKLVCRISELESIKEKQSLKLIKLKEEMDSITRDLSKSRNSSDNVVQSLSQELRAIKIELEKVQDREKQLLDFRCVISKMLGLDVNSLAVADYEIISRLERVISSFNEGMVPIQAVPTATTFQAVHHINPIYDYSSSTSATSGSEQKHHHHHHHKSSSGGVHHHHSHQDLTASHIYGGGPSSPASHHHAHHVHHASRTDSSSSPVHVTRSRSKSPRKVTIDPNAY